MGQPDSPWQPDVHLHDPIAGAPFDQIGRQYMADALSGNTTAGYGPGAGFNVTRAQVLVLGFSTAWPWINAPHLQCISFDGPSARFGGGSGG